MEVYLSICLENSVNAVMEGIEMLLSPRALKSLNSIEKILLRLMVATFNGNPSTTIISCHGSINASNETDLITFYNELSSLVRSIPKHNILIIGRDMNTQIGKGEKNKFCLNKTSNRNGEYRIEFLIENRQTCLNTNFQKREGKLWTYTHANNAKAQIDYILVNKWTVRHISFSKGYLPITEFSQQRYT